MDVFPTPRSPITSTLYRCSFRRLCMPLRKDTRRWGRSRRLDGDENLMKTLQSHRGTHLKQLRRLRIDEIIAGQSHRGKNDQESIICS
ncbi:hypothetical protein EYF80_030702 [Liparis tanakae]|uniref:Uncharacterized protein n=1 Tax=Liparis tanakae TaxID=230148 RepID=A0A4Z2GZN2_9TELE|nr:hypothetical protein EYF80_030702 [Liparis tanakae]